MPWPRAHGHHQSHQRRSHRPRNTGRRGGRAARDCRCQTGVPKLRRTTKEERSEILRNLHNAVSARIGDLTDVMVEEYGGVRQFAGPIVQSGADLLIAAEKALHELPLTRSWGKTTVTLEPVGVAGLISPWN